MQIYMQINVPRRNCSAMTQPGCLQFLYIDTLDLFLIPLSQQLNLLGIPMTHTRSSLSLLSIARKPQIPTQFFYPASTPFTGWMLLMWEQTIRNLEK